MGKSSSLLWYMIKTIMNSNLCEEIVDEDDATRMASELQSTYKKNDQTFKYSMKLRSMRNTDCYETRGDYVAAVFDYMAGNAGEMGEDWTMVVRYHADLTSSIYLGWFNFDSFSPDIRIWYNDDNFEPLLKLMFSDYEWVDPYTTLLAVDNSLSSLYSHQISPILGVTRVQTSQAIGRVYSRHLDKQKKAKVVPIDKKTGKPKLPSSKNSNRMFGRYGSKPF